MKTKVILYALSLMLAMGISRHVLTSSSGGLYAQTETTSQKNLKKMQKKKLKDQIKMDKQALNRHKDIQTKATRKRMKQHLKQTKKNVKNSHR